MLMPGSVCLFQASLNVFLMLLTYVKSHSYILSMGAGGLVWVCFESAVPLQFTLIWWRMVLSSYSSYFPQIQILKEFVFDPFETNTSLRHTPLFCFGKERP